MRRLQALLLLAAQFIGLMAFQAAQADQLPTLMNALRDARKEPSLTSEFVFRNDPDEALIPVFLLGSVNRPGLYHIPRNTDLVALLTIAGGTSNDARLSDILIKNQSGEGMNRQLKIDLDNHFHTSDVQKFPLTSNDVVLVNSEKPWISNNTLTIVGIATSLATLVLTGLLIHDNLKQQ